MGAESDFECSFSATDLEDSVVQTGKVKDGTLTSKYFGHYTEALEYIKEQCEKISKVKKVLIPDNELVWFCPTCKVHYEIGTKCPKCGR